MTAPIESKADLRRRMRAMRIAHAESLPVQVRALIFHRPPRPLLDLVPEDAGIGLYHTAPGEASAGGYARFFAERGHPIALPWFADREASMTFRVHTDPFGGEDLEPGPFGPQPSGDALEIEPAVLFVPLLAFTAEGRRLGQGGGHYDRWLAAHNGVTAIGLAWDVQEVADLPHEPHDVPLRAVVTPTRFLGPFA